MNPKFLSSPSYYSPKMPGGREVGYWKWGDCQSVNEKERWWSCIPESVSQLESSYKIYNVDPVSSLVPLLPSPTPHSLYPLTSFPLLSTLSPYIPSLSILPSPYTPLHTPPTLLQLPSLLPLLSSHLPSHHTPHTGLYTPLP